MKNVLISCISLLRSDYNKNPYTKEPIAPKEYFASQISIKAYQTNEAFAKYLLKKLSIKNSKVDEYVCITTSEIDKEGNITIPYLKQQINEFCDAEKIDKPEFFLVSMGEEEITHQYNEVLRKIADEIRRIMEIDSDVHIYLDMAGGKRDASIFIHLLTRLFSHYNLDIHTYYTDISGKIVNTDSSFLHMNILDAVNEFTQFGNSINLKKCFKRTKNDTARKLLQSMETFSNAIQLNSLNIEKTLKNLHSRLDEMETITDYDDNVYIIKTMLPLIREKFRLDNSSPALYTLSVISWCLDNGLVQQALTIYNERVYEIVVGENLIQLDTEKYEEEIKCINTNTPWNKFNKSTIICLLCHVFERMQELPKYKDYIISDKGRKKVNRYTVCSAHQRVEAAAYFNEETLPEGVKINFDMHLCRNILSDIQFVAYARNRVNHASDNKAMLSNMLKIYSKAKIHYFSLSNPPSSFAANNIAKDLKRAVKNLKNALAQRKD